MVYAFFVGLTVGLPLGCYMREAGYASKLKSAYNVFVPPTEANKSDKFQNRSEEFYNNIKKGQADVKDFERYVYGGTFNDRNKDQTDQIEAEVKKKFKEYQK